MTDTGEPKRYQTVDDLPGPDEWPELAEFLRRAAAAPRENLPPDDIDQIRARIVGSKLVGNAGDPS